MWRPAHRGKRSERPKTENRIPNREHRSEQTPNREKQAQRPPEQRTTKAKADLSNVVIMNVPLRNHNMPRTMEFEIGISVNGSYESAGHRASLFGRLIDEHEIANLEGSGQRVADTLLKD